MRGTCIKGNTNVILIMSTTIFSLQLKRKSPNKTQISANIFSSQPKRNLPNETQISQGFFKPFIGHLLKPMSLFLLMPLLLVQQKKKCKNFRIKYKYKIDFGMIYKLSLISLSTFRNHKASIVAKGISLWKQGYALFIILNRQIFKRRKICTQRWSNYSKR